MTNRNRNRSKSAVKRPVKAEKSKTKSKSRAVRPKAKLMPKKSKEDIKNGLKDVSVISKALGTLQDMQPEKDAIKAKEVDRYLINKRKEQGRDLDSNEKSRIEATLSGSDAAVPMFNAKQIKEGSYAESREFADTDFVKALKRIDGLEDQIADATKRYLKTKRELIILSKILERAYQDMDGGGDTTDEEVSAFNIAHLSRALFPNHLN